MKSILRWKTIVLISLLCNACASQPEEKPRVDLLGDPASPSVATRTIAIHDNVKHVNMTGGEIINFVMGNATFAWNFDSAQDISPFNLRLITPPDILINHDVIVYVARNPLYMRDRGPFWSPWPP